MVTIMVFIHGIRNGIYVRVIGYLLQYSEIRMIRRHLRLVLLLSNERLAQSPVSLLHRLRFNKETGNSKKNSRKLEAGVKLGDPAGTQLPHLSFKISHL